MAPFRNDLEAADARKANLERELEEAEQLAADLRAKQEGTEPARPPKSKPKRRSSWYRSKKALAFPAMVLGVFVGLPAFGNIAAASCGYRATVIDAVERCPQAREALGDDIHFGRFGMACGSTSINDEDVGHDYARWRMPISGSRSSGVYNFNAQDHGQGWAVVAGQVEVDGTVIDLRTCSSVEPVDATPTSGHTSKSPGSQSPAEVLADKCEDGDARACRDLSFLYELGNTVEKDQAQASAYAAKACKLGLASACPSSPEPKDQP